MSSVGGRCSTGGQVLGEQRARDMVGNPVSIAIVRSLEVREGWEWAPKLASC